MTIKPVTSSSTASSVVDFLCSKAAFDLEMNDFRINARKKAVFQSIKQKNHKYWCMIDSGAVIGAIGVAENERHNSGYYLDYFSVHKDFRRKGIGSELLATTEKYLKDQHARFLLIDTSNKNQFIPARKLYEKSGYIQVSQVPDYYEPGVDRLDYYKSF